MITEVSVSDILKKADTQIYKKKIKIDTNNKKLSFQTTVEDRIQNVIDTHSHVIDNIYLLLPDYKNPNIIIEKLKDLMDRSPMDCGNYCHEYLSLNPLINLGHNVYSVIPTKEMNRKTHQIRDDDFKKNNKTYIFHSQFDYQSGYIYEFKTTTTKNLNSMLRKAFAQLYLYRLLFYLRTRNFLDGNFEHPGDLRFQRLYLDILLKDTLEIKTYELTEINPKKPLINFDPNVLKKVLHLSEIQINKEIDYLCQNVTINMIDETTENIRKLEEYFGMPWQSLIKNNTPGFIR